MSPLADTVKLLSIASTGIVVNIRTPIEFGLVIRDKRKDLGLTQTELARKVGVGRQWVVSIEQGKPRAEIGLVLRALAVLGIKLSIDSSDVPSRSSNENSFVDIDAIVDACTETWK